MTIDGVPTLTTERLRMREPRASDLDAFAAMYALEPVARYIMGKPQTREESWARLLRMAGQWRLLGFGFWIVEDRNTGEHLGNAGYVEGKRDMTPSIEGQPEIGWSLHPSAQGKGYATEAAQAALTWGERRFGCVRTVCIIAPENTPSIRVAERLGFVAATDTVYHGQPIRIFHRAPNLDQRS